MQATRVALVHYTGPPAIGGIESYIEAQRQVLHESGATTRLVVGNPGARDAIVIPWMQPASVAEFLADLGGQWPSARHAIVKSIKRDLLSAVADCEQVWVHNALSLVLNPFLTEAVQELIESCNHVRWIAWMEDISVASAFLDKDKVMQKSNLGVPQAVQIVTISQFRQSQVAQFFGRCPEEIAVIPPPINLARTLVLTQETKRLTRQLDLHQFEPVVLVPSKLLPHKRLDRAVQLAASLRDRFQRPLILITGAPSPHEPERSARLSVDLLRQARAHGVDTNIVILARELNGPISDATLLNLMLLADFAFVPSDEEGFNMALQEAALLRVPLLASDIPVHQEHVPGSTYLFSTSGSDALEAALSRIIADPVYQARRSAAESWNRFSKATRRLLTGEPLPSRPEDG